MVPIALVSGYDNASCESFMKTLKREEIYANTYRDLDHLRTNIAAFIDGGIGAAEYESDGGVMKSSRGA